MDNLVLELIELLEQLFATHQRLLAIADARRQAMRLFDVRAMNELLEREQRELASIQAMEQKRRNLIARFQVLLGRNVPATTTHIASRCSASLKTQLLALAAKLREAVQSLDRATRINSKVSQSVVAVFTKVLQAITGVAQHAGLYMRNGRKTAVAGIHLLDAVG